MSPKELQRIKVIENAAEGRIKVSEAARLLGLSTRQVQRLKARYEPSRVDWVRHGNRGKRKPWRLPAAARRRALPALCVSPRYSGLTMPGAGPIIEKVWEFVRSNPQAVTEMLRAAKDRFATAPPSPPPSGAQEQEEATDTTSGRLDQIEADITAVGRLLGSIEARLSEFSARLDGIDGRVDRSEAELVRATQAFTKLARTLRLYAFALGGGLLVAIGLLAYLVSR